VIAECAGSSVDRIRLLNPALRRLATPAHRSFDVRVPKGTAAATTSCLHAIPPERRVAFRAHVVTRGQTLATIARHYGTRPTDIAQANGLKVQARLARGQELIIPVSPGAERRAAQVAAAEPVPAPPVVAEATDPDEGRVRIDQGRDRRSAALRPAQRSRSGPRSASVLEPGPGTRIAACHPSPSGTVHGGVSDPAAAPPLD
jgi:membrane-bound lytic murein transglycosylase D